MTGPRPKITKAQPIQFDPDIAQTLTLVVALALDSPSFGFSQIASD
ncbi:hypothetical protein EST38_g4109 [Candolleomyces aberdarensis]|uniref:Uncharacterized protein n=1 Tax=Candolleomyces aberdarensis TaxID=2316362 RepID=A0A4Q2DNB9_9AGAR|nr:hypothetical protein EST38_g4109 [Candolleomyces aberdarensis]